MRIACYQDRAFLLTPDGAVDIEIVSGVNIVQSNNEASTISSVPDLISQFSIVLTS